MQNDNILTPLCGKVLEEELELTLADLCRACQVPAEQIIEIVQEGVVEPMGSDLAHWHFEGISVRRVSFVLRMQQDLGVNTAGSALVLDLLEELEDLRTRLRRYEG